MKDFLKQIDDKDIAMMIVGTLALCTIVVAGVTDGVTAKDALTVVTLSITGILALARGSKKQP